MCYTIKYNVQKLEMLQYNKINIAEVNMNRDRQKPLNNFMKITPLFPVPPHQKVG